MDTQRVAVILGYGIPTDILNDGNYRRYLRGALNLILAKNITKIILCGGHTNSGLPDASEADEMRKFICRMAPDARRFKFFLEEKSLTSFENLVGAAAYIAQCDCENPLEVFVFCEYTRRIKIRLLAKRLLRIVHPKCEVRIIGIDFDATRTFFKDMKQLAGVVFVALEGWFPFLEKWHKQRRIKKLKLEC